MAMSFDSGDWKPRYDLSAYLSGIKNSYAESAEQEELRKSQLANLMTLGKSGNELDKSNLEGALAAAKLANKNYIPSELAGEMATNESLGYKRDYDRDTLSGRIGFDNSKNAQGVLENEGKGIVTGAQNRALAGVAGGGIGFPMGQPEPLGQAGGYNIMPSTGAPTPVMGNMRKGGKPSDTPWSDQMSPTSEVGRMSAILGMDPAYAKAAALAEQKSDDAKELAAMRNAAKGKISDPKYKEQLAAHMKTVSMYKWKQSQGQPITKEEWDAASVADNFIAQHQQLLQVAVPGLYRPGIDMGGYGLPTTPAPVATARPGLTPPAGTPAQTPAPASGTAATVRGGAPKQLPPGVKLVN